MTKNALESSDWQEIYYFFDKILRSEVISAHPDLAPLINQFDTIPPQGFSANFWTNEPRQRLSLTQRENFSQYLAVSAHLFNLSQELAKNNQLLPVAQKKEITLADDQILKYVFLWHPSESNSYEFLGVMDDFQRYLNSAAANLTKITFYIRLLFQTRVSPTEKYDVSDTLTRMFKHFQNIYETLPEIYLRITNPTVGPKSKRSYRQILELITWLGGDADGIPECTAELGGLVITELATQLKKNYLADLTEIQRTEVNQKDQKTIAAIKQKLLSAKYSDSELFLADLVKLPRNQLVINLIQRVTNFKLVYAKLELRQNSLVHNQVLQEIIDILAQKKIVPEINLRNSTNEEKLRYLEVLLEKKQLWSRIKLKSLLSGLSQISQDLFARMDLIRQNPQSIENYAIAETQSSSDILTALFLAKLVNANIAVIPLFEKPNTLQAASKIMEQIFQSKYYQKVLADHQNKQEIMIGYSDSGRRSASVANRYLLVKAQSEMLAVAQRYSVNLYFHHANGDDLNRGGGNLREIINLTDHNLITKNAVQGRGWRIRFQNSHSIYIEILNFLDRKDLISKTQPLQTYPELTQKISEAIFERYRTLFFASPLCIEFISEVSAYKICGFSNYTMRAMARNGPPLTRELLHRLSKKTFSLNNVDAVRAIPWNHATEMIGLNTSILGLGALYKIIQSDLHANSQKIIPILQKLYQTSKLFKTQIDLADYALAMTNPDVIWQNSNLRKPDAIAIDRYAQEYENIERFDLLKFLCWIDQEYRLGSAAIRQIKPNSILSEMPRIKYLVSLQYLIGIPNKQIGLINENPVCVRDLKAAIDEYRLPDITFRYDLKN